MSKRPPRVLRCENKLVEKRLFALLLQLFNHGLQIDANQFGEVFVDSVNVLATVTFVYWGKKEIMTAKLKYEECSNNGNPSWHLDTACVHLTLEDFFQRNEQPLGAEEQEPTEIEIPQ